MNAQDKYRKALPSLRQSGGGSCHTDLLSKANLGVHAGIDPQQIHDDLRRHIQGSRRVPDREIKAAIEKALIDKGKVFHYNFKKRQQKPSFDGKKVRNNIIAKGAGITEADIWSTSPIKIDWNPEEDPIHLLTHLYQPDDLLFMGERYSPGIMNKTIRTVAFWKQYFSEGARPSRTLFRTP